MIFEPKIYTTVRGYFLLMTTNGSSPKHKNIILLSIDSQFSNEIFEGKKGYEFRKTALPSDLDYVVLLENGSRKITGGFRVENTHERDIKHLWEEFGKGVSDYDRFHDYYSGWEKGVAIEIGAVEKYDEPIDADKLTGTDPDLNIPFQFHFIYMTKKALEFLSSYSSVIDNLLPDTKRTTLERYGVGKGSNEASSLNFRPMKENEEDEFRDLFQNSPVPSEYSDINKGFIDHILESHRKGVDPYGYFTLKKKVYTLFKDEEIIGFTTTTWKRGNSVKYGPTMLKEEKRGEGLGSALRKLIDSRLKYEGVRKTYSTIPETHTSAYKYLIRSDYQIEAHMRRQYHEDHDELVFGKVLHGGSPSRSLSLSRTTCDAITFEVGSSPFDNFQNFVIKRAEPWYEEIDRNFVTSVQEAEERGLDAQHSKKGKRVFIGHQSGEIQSIAIASLKRGDAVKVSPVFTTITGDGLEKFWEQVEHNLRETINVRKIYTHVPVLDQALISFFRTSGFSCEGLLREPYKEGIDLVFFGKLVD